MEALISAVLQTLTSAAFRKIQDEVSGVLNVKKAVAELSKNLLSVEAMLSDAEQRQVTDKRVKVWLDELKEAFYDIEDLLDEWNTTATMKLLKDQGGDEDALVPKVCLCFSLFSRTKQGFVDRDIAKKIKEINLNLDEIAKRKNRFGFKDIRSAEKLEERVQSTSFIVESETFGRGHEKAILLSKLFDEGTEAPRRPHVISIVGMGGIGKTTLAQLVYNDDVVKNHFDKRIWVCVSDPFDELSIAKAIIDKLNVNSTSLDAHMERVSESIADNNFFLVLDDVWTEDYEKWEPFRRCLMNGCPRSKVLITTRNQRVAEIVRSDDIILVEKLPDNYCKSMFEQLALGGRSSGEREELKEVGEKIVERCKGLPLAIRTIGSLLRFKKTKKQWESILNSKLWELGEVEKGIFSPLLLSYYDLPPMVKPCFLYCATFPKDWELIKDQLIWLWMGQGYLGSDQEKKLEDIGEEFFNILVNRSLIIQEIRETGKDVFKIHDITHDVASLLSQDQCVGFLEGNDSANQTIKNGKIRHLMFADSFQTQKIRLSPDVFNLKKLRSFILLEKDFLWKDGWNWWGRQSFGGQEVPQQFFDQLTKLRSLVLCRASGKIPEEIGQLIHLRLLDLSCCGEIRNLPDALWQLCNLQTLRCPIIKRLPEGIGKLSNLRHLFLHPEYRLDPLPREIGRLIHLRKLTLFSACRDNFACLKNLIHLRFLKIDVCEDVENAELDTVDHLLELELTFCSSQTTATASEDFLKAIRRPPKLEGFDLGIYEGGISALPDWIMSSSTLKHLSFSRCGKWERLPPLGKLPNLESLKVERMREIKRVSDEFLGVERSGAPSKIVFPKLKYLTFFDMPEWAEWDYGFIKKEEEDISIMPCLQTFRFFSCPSLKVVPEDLFRKPTLEELAIDYSSKILHEHYQEWRMRREGETSTANN